MTKCRIQEEAVSIAIGLVVDEGVCPAEHDRCPREFENGCNDCWAESVYEATPTLTALCERLSEDSACLTEHCASPDMGCVDCWKRHCYKESRRRCGE